MGERAVRPRTTGVATRLGKRIAVLALATAAFASDATAQIRASEIGTTSQIVDGTTITVRYSRPRARGRDPIFGTRIVHWGEVWTPGANYATTFEVDRPVKLDGHTVPKGRYSVWMVVRENDDWTLVLDPRDRRFHMDPPDSTAAQIRFPIRATTGPFTEALTWSFPDYRVNGATLAMQWATKRVAMDVTVEPSLRVELAAADAAPYLGEYDYVEPQRTGPPKRTRFTVTHESGIMKGRWEPNDAYMGHFALIRVGRDTFAPGLYDKDGKIYEVLRPDMIFTFSRTDGRVTKLEARYDDDTLAGSATRRP
jgi:hypothetical protein